MSKEYPTVHIRKVVPPPEKNYFHIWNDDVYESGMFPEGPYITMNVPEKEIVQVFRKILISDLNETASKWEDAVYFMLDVEGDKITVSTDDLNDHNVQHTYYGFPKNFNDKLHEIFPFYKKYRSLVFTYDTEKDEFLKREW